MEHSGALRDKKVSGREPSKVSKAPAITCWHCGKLSYRPQRLGWGKDLIPLHDGCIGAWIDAWDAMLSR
jgi:hypothetical protein